MPAPPRAPLRARRGWATLAGLPAALAAPERALAHGLEVPPSPPIPVWLFTAAAALVLVVSFAALSVGWRTPLLERLAAGHEVPLPVVVRRAGRALLGALGVGLFALGAWAGLTGTTTPQENLEPTLVLAVLWVGVPVLSLVLGDVWRAVSPWRAVADLIAWAAARRGRLRAARRRYPPRAGAWPAAAVLLAFGWLELVDPGRDGPSHLATLSLLYGAAMLAGTAVYGRRFLDEADGFGVAFGLIAHLAPLRFGAHGVRVRAPGVGVAEIAPVPGLAAVVLVLIGITTFDGLSAAPVWTRPGALGPRLEQLAGGLGLDAAGAVTAARTVGLLVGVALAAALVLVVADRAAADGSVRAVVRRQAPTYVPIAAGYAVAHAVTLIVVQSQVLLALLSDPRGTGADPLGTEAWGADPSLLPPGITWAVQVGALLGGHLVALVAAHDLALRDARTGGGCARAAARAQRWSLVAMVAFTTLGLRLLSS